MSGKPTLKADVVKQYMHRYPDTPTLTLARTIYKNESELFKSSESVRSFIRYLRGQSGSTHRKYVAGGQFLSTGGERNPFAALPEGIKHFDEWTPVMLPEEKTLVIGDLHVPYQDKEVLLLALEYGYKEGVGGVLILGDFVDFYSASRWETDPRKRDMWKEIETAREVLNVIRAGFPDAKIRVKMGNHDERYERWLWVKAPELLNVPDFQYEKFLHFEKHAIELIAERRILKINGLHLIHGHEFGRMFSDPVNPARGIYNRGKAHCLCAHWHRDSYHPEASMDGKLIGCWSIGCMCDRHPDYMPINKWSPSFAIVSRLEGDEFLVQNHSISKGRVF